MLAAQLQGQLAEALAAVAQIIKQACRGRQADIGELVALAGQGAGMSVIAMCLVEQGGTLGDAVEQFASPAAQVDGLALALQLQAGLAALFDHALEVVLAGRALVAGQRRAVAQAAIEQEGIEEMRLGQVDAQRQVGIDVQAAHFHILHAACGQCLQWAFAG